MVERRNPLVLSSTRTTLRSVLNSLQPVAAGGDRVLNKDGISGGSDLVRRKVRLSAGILRCHRDGGNVSDVKLDSLDDSALIGLSTQLLKRLSINSGSLVSPLSCSVTDLHNRNWKNGCFIGILLFCCWNQLIEKFQFLGSPFAGLLFVALFS